MHASRLLSHWLNDHTVIAHKARAQALLKLVQALLGGGKLSLTQLGRHRRGPAYVKHHIKAADRLLGNPHLHRERDGLYRAIARTLLFGNARPVIIVDWSDFQLGREWLMIKAAVPVGGRAVSLYERVYPFKRYNSPRTHREFLQALKSILPEDCRPIIVTDAGFRGPWFRAVEALGWDWVGRIRNRIKYYHEETGRWRFTDSLYKEATSRIRYIGQVSLSRRHRYCFRMYLVRAYKPRIGRPPRRKKYFRTMYRRLHRAPWLLATSLSHEKGSLQRIKRLYAQRMQIEETFRDMKCHRWGFGLRYGRCTSARRLEMLLLISALASLVLWLVGLCARALDWSRRVQANTERKRPVLSIVFVGQQLVRREIELPDGFLLAALVQLRELMSDALPA
jgi:DDE family transposase